MRSCMLNSKIADDIKILDLLVLIYKKKQKTLISFTVNNFLSMIKKDYCFNEHSEMGI